MKIFLLIFLFSFSFLFSNEKAEEILSNNNNVLNFLKGPSNFGTEFWLTVPPPYLVADPNAFTRIFIASNEDCIANLTMADGSESTLEILAGTVKSFNLSPAKCQPYIWQVGTKANPAQVYKDKALHLTSSVPIIVYVVVRYQYTSDGYLAFPVDGLGKNYIATNYDARPYNGTSLPNMLCVVASNDNTNVDITLGGSLNGNLEVEVNTGKKLKSGDNHKFRLDEGDVLVLSNSGDFQTLSGTLITSNNDIAVFSGNTCADIPVNTYTCDYTVEQDFPIETWGNIYCVPQYENRLKPSVLRIFAKDNNTTIWRDGNEFAYLELGCAENGGTQDNAWIESRIFPIESEPKPAIFTANKPIYISYYNQGQTDDNQGSDPFSLLISPLDKFQNEIIFSTPAAEGGKSFSDNYLYFVIEIENKEELPDDLMLGKLNNQTNTYDWINVKEVYGSGVSHVSEVGSGDDKNALQNSEYFGKKYGYKQILLPGDGVYKLKSNSVFAAYSMGFDSFDSYGYPTAGIFTFNSDDEEKPIINLIVDCNGYVVGKSTDDKKNPKNIGLITPKIDYENSSNFSNMSIETYKFKPGDEEIDWTMNVLNPNESARAVVYFSDRSGNVAVDTIEYVPSSVAIPSPEIAYNGSLLLCDSESSVTLTILDKGYERFEWSNGETTESIIVNEAGNYNVKVFDENDCFLISESIEVVSVAETELKISKSNTNDVICQGEVITLTANVKDSGSLLWSTGETTNEIEVSESGEYYYSFTPENIECEFTSEIIEVEFTELPEKPVIVYDNLTLNIETESEKINWYFNDVLAEKFSDMKSITPEFDGEYYCEVFESTNTCSSVSDTYNVNWMSVLDDINENDISITPNPNNGIFNLRIDSEINGNVTLNIYDINGQSVCKQELLINTNTFNLEINVPKVSKGIYILNLSNGNKEINKKLIIE